MGLIKLIFKLLVLPLIVAVTLIQWVGIFFTQFSTAIFNLLAGLMFLITIAGWMFGISAGAETLRLLAVAFVVFIIPHIAEAYLRYEKAFERIVSGCPAAEWEDDEYDLDEV